MFGSGYEVVKVMKFDGVREFGGFFYLRVVVWIICFWIIGKLIVFF